MMNELEEIFEWVKTDLEERLLKDLFSGEMEKNYNLLYVKGVNENVANGGENRG